MAQGADITSLLRGLDAMRDRALAAGKAALRRGGLYVQGKAQQLAPVDTGALKASAMTDQPTEVDGVLSVRVSFNTDYAAAVHERLDLHHPQGQAKYLSTAIDQNKDKVIEMVAAKVREALSS